MLGSSIQIGGHGVDATPVDGNIGTAVSSDWGFDHAADADAHIPELLPSLISRGHLMYIPTGVGWATSLANGGTVGAQPTFIQPDTNAGANASAIAYVYPSFLLIGATNADNINWDKKLWLRCGFYGRNLGGTHTNSVYRLQIKDAVTEGALADKGIGISINAMTDIYAESYGSALQATDTAVNNTSYQANWLDIIHCPGSKVEFYINNALVVTHSTAANVPSGNSTNACAIVASAINGASSGDGRFYVGHIFLWQGV